jgi:phosphoribosylamine--glycine ligase
MQYNILVIGSGGREHAMVNKIIESDLCEECFVLPGNPGTEPIATNLKVPVYDFERIAEEIKANNIQIVVVGPEVPLVDGITDYLNDVIPGVIVIGPNKKAAQLEGSKSFAKEFMRRHDIPTAAYLEVTKNNLTEGLQHIDSTNGPYVLKADGLASGKGVLILQDKEEAKSELKSMIEGKFGDASSTVVIEEFLDGIEFSVFVLTDGKNYVLLPEAKDYKRIGEGDTGLNTGGMGAVSPVPFFNDSLKEKVISGIIQPTIDGLVKDDIEYKGFIFVGLIMVNDEPYVIEYNCRMGDPETEAVFPRIKSDIVDAFLKTGSQNLDDYSMEVSKDAASTVIMVSGGYPEDFKKGFKISNLENTKNSIVFHSGTANDQNGDLITNGGRVLAITTLHSDFREGLRISKQNAEIIDYKNKYFRRDIGFDL